MRELHLDFGVDASWERKILKRIDRLWRSVDDVDEALVDLHLESLAAGLIDVWGLHYGESGTLGWKWNWTTYLSTGTNCGVDDLLRALINQAMIVSFEANADLETLGFVCHIFDLSCFSHNLR